MNKYSSACAILAVVAVLTPFVLHIADGKVTVTARHAEDDVANLAVTRDCGDDIWCQKFCPYVHHLFKSSLTEPMACALGLQQQVNCSQAWFCATWCPYIYVQISVPLKPAEWDICTGGGMPLGCRDDPSCTQWCDAIYDDYKNAPVSLKGCLTTGEMMEGCEDQKFCEEICDRSRAANLKTQPTFVQHCGFTGKP